MGKRMNKIYPINYRWKFLLALVTIILIAFTFIMVTVYMYEKSLFFLLLAFLMFILSGILIFGILNNKIIVSSDGITSFIFGRSRHVSWVQIQSVEINPFNLHVFARILNASSDIFSISMFINSIRSNKLLYELVQNLPKEKIQLELYEFIVQEMEDNR